MHRAIAVFLIAMIAPLAGCDTINNVLGLNNTPQIVLEPGPPCPATAVLSDAATVTKFKAGTMPAMAKPADVALQAEMSKPKLDCNYDRVNNTLSVTVNFAVRAARGPAALAADPQLPFFVAIIDSDNNVIAKSLFNSQPQMSGRASNTYTESVSNVPVPLAMDRQPSDYEILTGFQLTAAELAYNRIPRPNPAPRAATR